jgi:hypothetical protein
LLCRAWQLLDANGDGVINLNDFSSAIGTTPQATSITDVKLKRGESDTEQKLKLDLKPDDHN